MSTLFHPTLLGILPFPFPSFNITSITCISSSRNIVFHSSFPFWCHFFLHFLFLTWLYLLLFSSSRNVCLRLYLGFSLCSFSSSNITSSTPAFFLQKYRLSFSFFFNFILSFCLLSCLLTSLHFLHPFFLHRFSSFLFVFFSFYLASLRVNHLHLLPPFLFQQRQLSFPHFFSPSSFSSGLYFTRLWIKVSSLSLQVCQAISFLTFHFYHHARFSEFTQPYKRLRASIFTWFHNLIRHVRLTYSSISQNRTFESQNTCHQKELSQKRISYIHT